MPSRDLRSFSGKGLFYKISFLLAIPVYFITALNSHGYYHADEHYQILEFAEYIDGKNSTEHLAWEFEARIRSAVQPVIAFLVFRALSVFSVVDPYSKALVLRLLTACLALLIIRRFVKNTIASFTTEWERRAYFLLSFFLWVIPFLSVRFSGETWSGLFLLLSLAILSTGHQKSWQAYKIGLVLGLAFIFRFQAGFAMIGILLWLLIVKKTGFHDILKIGIGIVAVVLAGFCVDTWFYGEAVFTPWNYLMSVLNSGGTGYGTSPWYFYILELLQFPTYFIGIPLVLSIMLIMIYEPKNLYLWTLLIFIVIHSFVPHKEDRFLFPLFYLFPILLMTGYTKLKSILKQQKILKMATYVLAIMFLVTNLGGLITMGLQSAAKGRMAISKYIHDHYADEHINIIYTYWANPYRPFQGLYSRFYLEKEMSHQFIGDLYHLSDSVILPDAVNFLVVRKEELKPDHCGEMISGYRFIPIMQSIPGWVEVLTDNLYKGFKEGNVLCLYRYETAAY